MVKTLGHYEALEGCGWNYTSNRREILRKADKLIGMY